MESRNSYQPRLVWDLLPWLKLQYLCGVGPTEIAGYGIGDDDDPLHIVDFCLIKQKATSVSFEFDDVALIRHCEEHQEAGISIEQCFRVWVHTHPGNSATPSGYDWQVWGSNLAKEPWKVMMILARGGEVTSHMRVGGGPGLPRWEGPIRMSVDLNSSVPYNRMGKLRDSWRREYRKCVNAGPLIQDLQEARKKSTETCKPLRVVEISPSEGGPAWGRETDWRTDWLNGNITGHGDSRLRGATPRMLPFAEIKNETSPRPVVGASAVEVVTIKKPVETPPSKETTPNVTTAATTTATGATNGGATTAPRTGAGDDCGIGEREWLGSYFERGWEGGLLHRSRCSHK